MKFNRNSLCWLLVLVMALCVLSGGCGGSSSSDSGGSGSEDVSVPETPNTNTPDTPTTTPETPSTTSPDNTAPAPETPSTNNPNNTGINGTWRIASGKITITVPGQNISANYAQGSASAQQFTISVSKNTSDQYYTIALSGNGVNTSELKEGSVTVRFEGDDGEVDAILGSSMFEASGNGYSTPRLMTSMMTIVSYQLANSSTINYSLTNQDNMVIDMTLTRVN